MRYNKLRSCRTRGSGAALGGVGDVGSVDASVAAFGFDRLYEKGLREGEAGGELCE